MDENNTQAMPTEGMPATEEQAMPAAPANEEEQTAAPAEGGEAAAM